MRITKAIHTGKLIPTDQLQGGEVFKKSRRKSVFEFGELFLAITPFKEDEPVTEYINLSSGRRYKDIAFFIEVEVLDLMVRK